MTCLEHRADDVSRKRKASLARSLSFDHDFLLFLQGELCGPNSQLQENPADVAERVKEYASQLASVRTAPVTAALVSPHDLPGALSAGHVAMQEACAALSGEPCQTQSSQQLQQPQPSSTTMAAPSHRAVTTGMPLPRSSSAAAAAPAADNNDDNTSAATLPMPSKRRRTDDEEVTSSPNDLVEVAPAAVITTAAGRTAVSRAAAAGPASSAQSADTAAAGATDTAKAAAATAGSTAAADAGVKKAILVSKVLTKSDSNSKRIILPRIAVEYNLPQLAHSTAFNLSATDLHGQSWPLVIKAWANGQNPKPVFVLEQVGELLKLYKLTVGDAVALLASSDGRFFLEWNTEAARAAAARPTFSGITFDSKAPQQQKNSAAATVDAGKEQQQVTVQASDPVQEAAGANAPATEQHALQQQQQQQGQDVQHSHLQVDAPYVNQLQLQQQPAADVQQLQPPQLHLPPPLPKQLVAASAAAAQRRQQAALQLPPLMTAVPVNPTPFVSGTFIPTSPCQLLVMGDGTAPYFKMEESAPSLPSSMLVTRSDAAMELPEADVLVMKYGVGGVDGAGELLSGAFLQCPRTAGCTRPAGHQGWCLGHKGYKKRRV